MFHRSSLSVHSPRTTRFRCILQVFLHRNQLCRHVHTTMIRYTLQGYLLYLLHRLCNSSMHSLHDTDHSLLLFVLLIQSALYPLQPVLLLHSLTDTSLQWIISLPYFSWHVPPYNLFYVNIFTFIYIVYFFCDLSTKSAKKMQVFEAINIIAQIGKNNYMEMRKILT